VAEVSSPASSGNLGPGFDSLALALELRCSVRATPATAWSASHLGPHAPGDQEEDVVLAAAQRMVGSGNPLALVVDNRIPLSKGLGSSSAACAAGAAAALLAVSGELDADAVFELVSECEGHGDNAAAAVFGGLVGVGADGTPIALTMDARWRVLVAIPPYELPTHLARAALDPSVDRGVVVRNLGRLLALIEGLRTGDEDLLARAGGDELHEVPRAPLHAAASEIMEAARRAGAAHAAWSGAGPAVLAICDATSMGAVEAALRQVLPDVGVVMALEVAQQGLMVAG